jgi:predicted deacylase
MTLVPADYAEARRVFLVAARRREFGLESHSVDGHPDLLTDVARLGPLGAAKLLVILSGTHGNEGLAGSAIQRDTIEGLAALLAAHGGLPETFALLLVHAVDPWGMARMRRQNARNIDLNRNFRDWSVPPCLPGASPP